MKNGVGPLTDEDVEGQLIFSDMRGVLAHELKKTREKYRCLENEKRFLREELVFQRNFLIGFLSNLVLPKKVAQAVSHAQARIETALAGPKKEECPLCCGLDKTCNHDLCDNCKEKDEKATRKRIQEREAKDEAYRLEAKSNEMQFRGR